tara:strand:- start:366 stop:842 length:477 start_codon:yes stop_codon:yes gene_type:complete
VIGIKHFIECHCVLPQYRNAKKPIYFGFSAFSEVDDGNSVKLKYSQCPNCGVIHKVYDLCKSEILAGKDESAVIRSFSDIKLSIPEHFVQLLESHNCEFADYEKLEFILDNELWSERILLSTDFEENDRVGKMLTFSSKGKPKVEPFMSKELIDHGTE